MKLLAPILFCILLVCAIKPTNNPKARYIRPKSCGYTVIENGRGIDCNGDTITLVKVKFHGWQRK